MEEAVIEELAKSGRTEQVLFRGSREREAIKALQRLLHELGYDGALRWDTYGADGDYGGCTVRAVGAFACEEGLEADGSCITPALAEALKALDGDFPRPPDEDKRDDQNRCDRFRGQLVEKGNFQMGWAASNRKSLEPPSIAPTWIHMDVRQYARRYLADGFFVRSAEELSVG